MRIAARIAWGFAIFEICLTLWLFAFRPYGVVARWMSCGLVMPAAFVQSNLVSYHRVAVYAHTRGSFDDGLAQALQEARVENIANHLRVDKDQVEEEVLLSEEYQRPSYDRLESIQTRIDIDGMPFIDAARYFSEHVSAIDSGDLGVLMLNEMPTWMASAVYELDIAQKTGIVEAPEAFWLFRVTDKGGEGDQTWFRLRGIAVNKQLLYDLISTSTAEHPAFVFVW